MTPEDREYWEFIKSRVPDCPVFQRMRPSIEVLRADVCVNQEFDNFEAAWKAELAADNADNEEPKP